MYAYQMDVPRSIESYEKVQPELEKKAGGWPPQGCRLHMVTKTAEGFRVTEVWDSHEACDRFGDEVRRPVIQDALGFEAAAGVPPPNQELELHRLETS